jgi:hypothetical protein
MEVTAYFERKVALTPRDLNRVRDGKVDDVLMAKMREQIEEKCSEHGFVLPGSLKMISRSMGYYEQVRFTADAVYQVKLEAKVLYPVDGVRVIGEVIRKNKLGLYVVHRGALRIQVPRDLHIGNAEFDNVEIGDSVEVELKKSRFQINDAFILTNGLFVHTVGRIGETEVKKAPAEEAAAEETKEEGEEAEEGEEEAGDSA